WVTLVTVESLSEYLFDLEPSWDIFRLHRLTKGGGAPKILERLAERAGQRVEEARGEPREAIDEEMSGISVGKNEEQTEHVEHPTAQEEEEAPLEKRTQIVDLTLPKEVDQTPEEAVPAPGEVKHAQETIKDNP
ncbi:hypothetical protein U1Q18_036599, partial [Sarracenia purpurea var. burkii]